MNCPCRIDWLGLWSFFVMCCVALDAGNRLEYLYGDENCHPAGMWVMALDYSGGYQPNMFFEVIDNCAPRPSSSPHPATQPDAHVDINRLSKKGHAFESECDRSRRLVAHDIYTAPMRLADLQDTQGLGLYNIMQTAWHVFMFNLT